MLTVLDKQEATYDKISYNTVYDRYHLKNFLFSITRLTLLFFLDVYLNKILHAITLKKRSQNKG
jgi:hypothetical protein